MPFPPRKPVWDRGALWRALVACLFVGAVPSAAVAQTTYFWTGTSVWTDAAAWSATISGTDAGAVPGSGDVAFFSAETVSGSAATVSLGGGTSVDVGGLQFGGTTATGTTTLLGGGTQAIVLRLFGGTSIVLDANATAGATIGSATASDAVDIRLNATTTTWTNDSARVLTILNTVSNVAGPTTLTISGSGETSLQGVVFDSVGALGITKLGSGTLRLGAANTYTGTTTLNAGTILLENAQALGGSTLDLRGGSLSFGSLVSATFGGLSGTSNLSLANASAAAVALTVGANGESTTYSGNLSGGGSFAKTGAGTLILAGTNTYSGTTQITQGVLAISTTSALASGTVNLAAAGTLDLPANNSASTRTWANALTGSGTVRLNFSSGVATNTSLTGLSGFNGTVRLLASAPNGDKLTVSSALTASGATVEVNPGTTLFTSAATTFGAIRVSGTGNTEGRGALRVASSTLTGPVTLLGDTRMSFEAGTLAGTVTGGTTGPITLTLGGAGATTGTLSGIISNGSGVVSIVSAAGDTLLSGVNTYTGQTTINAGSRIRVNADSGLGAAPGSAVSNQLVIAGGTLAVVTAGQTLSANRGIAISGSATLDTSSLANTTNNGSTFSGAITGTGPLTIRANGDQSASGGSSNTYVNLNATSDFVGDVTITSGIVGPLNNASFGAAGNRVILAGGGIGDPGRSFVLIREIAVQPTATGTNVLRTFGTASPVLAGPLTGSGNVNLTDSGTWTFTGDLSAYSGTMTTQGGSVRLFSSGSTLGGTYASLNTFSIAGYVGQTLAGNITGSGVISKFGAGTLTLTGTNSYSGGTNIVGGTLSAASISDSGGVGSIGPYTSSTPGYLGVQGGAFRYTGSGTQSSNRNFWMNSAPGTIDVVNATADITFAGTGGDTTFTLTKTGSGRLTIADAVGGAAAFVVDQGTLTLTGANTYTGTTSVTGGRLVLGNQTAVSTASAVVLGSSGSISFGTLTTATFANLSGSGSLVLTNTAATPAAVRLTVGGNNLGSSFTGNLTGLGGIVKTGSGILSLTGANTYSGTTTVSGGVLAVSSTSALPGWSTAGRVSVAAGAGLALDNSFSDADYATVAASGNVAAGGLLGFDTSAGDRTFTPVLSGTLGLVKTGANTLILAQPVAASGPTRVLGGTLNLGGFVQPLSGTLTVNGGVLANGIVSSTSTYDIVSGTVSASLSGSVGLTKSGTGTAWLTAANYYSGTTSVTGGVLAIASTASLPGWNTSGRYLVGGGAGLAVGNAVTDANVSTILATGNFATNAQVGFDTTAGDRTSGLAIANTGSGALGLVKVGPNTLTLTGSSTYTGGTLIAGGTLRVAALGDSGYSSLGTSGTLTINGGVFQFAGASASTGRVIVFGTNVGGTIDVVSGATLTTSGNWLGGGGVTKTGEGTLTVTQNYTGPRVNIGPESGGDFTMTAGTLNISNAFTFSQGSSRAATFLQTGGVVNAGETYIGDGTGNAYTSTYTLTGGTFNQSTGTFRVGTNGLSRGFFTIGGGAAPAVANVVTMQLATSANTEGTLVLGTSGLLATAGVARGAGFATTIFDGGTLRLTGNNTSLLTGVTTLVRSGGATLDTGTFTVTIDQAIAPDTGSTGGLVKNGAGILRLGAVNTYTGTTAVNAGILAISTTAALPGWDTAGRWTVAAGAGLAVGNRVSDSSIATILSGGNLSAGDNFGFDTTEGNRSYGVGIADLASGTLGLVKIGGNSLTLTAANTYTGSTSILSGTLATALPAALATTGTVVVAPGASLQVAYGAAGGFATADVSSLAAKTSFGSTASLLVLDTTLGSGTANSLTIGGGLTQFGGNRLILSGSTTIAGALTPSVGGIDLGSGTATVGAVSLTTVGMDIVNGTLRPSSVAVSNASGTVSLAASLGSGGVTKTGAGTLSLTGPSTATAGGLAATGGLVLVPAGSGSFGGSVSVGSGGTLRIDGGSVTTAASLSVTTGTFILSAGSMTASRFITADASAAQSDITISGGTLTITGNVNTANNQASFLVGHWSGGSRSTITMTGGVLSATSAVMMMGLDSTAGNTFTQTGGVFNVLGFLLNSANSGTYTLNGGRLNLGASGINTNASKTINLASGTVGALANWTATQNLNLTSTSGITFDTADAATAVARTITLSGNLSGTGGLRAVGPGILVLGGSNSYAGATVASVGTLRLSSTFALPGGAGATGGTANLALTGLLDLAATDFLRPLGTGTSAFQFTGEGGFAATGGARTVNLGGAGAQVTWGAGSFLPDGAAFLLSSTTANNTLTFANPIDLGASNRTVQVARGTGTLDAVLSGSLSGAGGLVKTGSGFLRLTGTNTYAGTTTISSGALWIGSTNALPGWSTAGAWSAASGAALAVDNAVADADVATLLGTTNFAAGSALGFDTTTADRTYAASITDTAQGSLGLVKVGANALFLSASNSFTGPTTVSSGSLVLQNQFALGNSPLNTANLQASGTTLVFDQSVIGRAFTIGGLSGTGRIALQNNAATPLPITLTINGDASGFTGSFSGTGSIVKAGAGSLALTSSLMSLTGTSVVSGGSLTVTGGSLVLRSVANGPATASGGGTLTTDALTVNGLTGLYTPANSGQSVASLASLSALDSQVMNQGLSMVASSSLAGADFNFGTGGGFPTPYNAANTTFAARWSGQFNATTSGTYTFKPRATTARCSTSTTSSS